MTEKNSHILNIGCGMDQIPDSIGIDIDPKSCADIIHDLNKYPYPVESNAFDRIYAKHILEHLEDPKRFICEVTRMLKPGGTVFIETPHFSSRVAYSDTQHRFFYSYFTFESLTSGTDLNIEKREITFYKSYRQCGIKFLANRFPDNYERFWTYIFPAENLKVVLKK